jgi:hypothetical protein
MFARAQPVDEKVEISVRQGRMRAAKRGYDFDTDLVKGREMEDGDGGEAL